MSHLPCFEIQKKHQPPPAAPATITQELFSFPIFCRFSDRFLGNTSSLVDGDQYLSTACIMYNLNESHLDEDVRIVVKVCAISVKPDGNSFSKQSAFTTLTFHLEDDDFTRMVGWHNACPCVKIGKLHKLVINTIAVRSNELIAQINNPATSEATINGLTGNPGHFFRLDTSGPFFSLFRNEISLKTDPNEYVLGTEETKKNVNGDKVDSIIWTVGCTLLKGNPPLPVRTQLVIVVIITVIVVIINTDKTRSS